MIDVFDKSECTKLENSQVETNLNAKITSAESHNETLLNQIIKLEVMI